MDAAAAGRGEGEREVFPGASQRVCHLTPKSRCPAGRAQVSQMRCPPWMPRPRGVPSSGPFLLPADWSPPLPGHPSEVTPAQSGQHSSPVPVTDRQTEPGGTGQAARPHPPTGGASPQAVLPLPSCPQAASQACSARLGSLQMLLSRLPRHPPLQERDIAGGGVTEAHCPWSWMLPVIKVTSQQGVACSDDSPPPNPWQPGTASSFLQGPHRRQKRSTLSPPPARWGSGGEGLAEGGQVGPRTQVPPHPPSQLPWVEPAQLFS